MIKLNLLESQISCAYHKNSHLIENIKFQKLETGAIYNLQLFAEILIWKLIESSNLTKKLQVY